MPADPEQPGDRRERHLLRQPRHDVLKVARVCRAWPGPRDRLEGDLAAVRAAQPAQLALDHAPVGAEVEVAPALAPAVVDLQLAARLTAERADASPAAQADRHHDPLRAERDVDDRCPGQTQQPLECRGDAHVALLRKPLVITNQQPAAGAASRRSDPAQLPRDPAVGKTPANARRTRPFRPPLHPQTARRPRKAALHPTAIGPSIVGPSQSSYPRVKIASWRANS